MKKLSQNMDLYKHQQDLLDRNPRAELLCWDTGTGKTRGALEWVKFNGFGTILIVCPKALKENWKRECDKWLDDQYYNVFIMSKEEFRRDWEGIGAFPTIIDEAHYFSGMRGFRKVSQMAKALFGYIKKHDTPRLLLTATPYLSTPWNIYMFAKHLGHNWKYMDFKDRFFQDRPMGLRTISEPRPGIEDEMALLVKHLGSTIKITEAADVPDQVFEREDFNLTNQQKVAKKAVFETNPIVRFTKDHQIENGTLKGDGYTENVFFKSEKTERVISLAEQTKKTAIVCRYNLQIDFYVAELEKKLKKKVYIIRGDVKNRDEIIQKVEASEECVIIINASCSEGYELPSVGLCVFASMSFSYKDYKQMLGRFLRINKLKKNVYIHLVSQGVDAGVYDAIMAKQDFDIAIYSKNIN